MKKLKITGIASAAVALVLEILPYGISMKWADFFYERVTYHSYFDLTVWGYGDMAPFLCGLLTVACLAMVIASMFFRPGRAYLFSMSAISMTAVIMSIIPAFFDSYTIFGLIITVLLAVATELSIMMYLNEGK